MAEQSFIPAPPPTPPTAPAGARHRSQRTPNWLRAFYATLAAILVVVALAVAFAPSTPRDALPRCKSETDTHCYWDASTQGNGHGHDFVSP
jgi:hypothetical protein